MGVEFAYLVERKNRSNGHQMNNKLMERMRSKMLML